jgi:hypothetical protein
MRSNLEFRSVNLDDAKVTDGSPRGRAVARLISVCLPDYGFHVNEVGTEDWGWEIKVTYVNFALLIGCGAYPRYDDGYLCFIEPKMQSIRRWFRKTSTIESVERLATAIETIVQQSGKAADFRWWTEAENAKGYVSRRAEAVPSLVSAG